MKRGRPNIRQVIQSSLVDILTTSQTPLTVSTLTRFVSQQSNRTISWNTVQKYLNELIVADRIQVITLPHSKFENKDGLTVYTLKK